VVRPESPTIGAEKKQECGHTFDEAWWAPEGEDKVSDRIKELEERVAYLEAILGDCYYYHAQLHILHAKDPVDEEGGCSEEDFELAQVYLRKGGEAARRRSMEAEGIVKRGYKPREISEQASAEFMQVCDIMDRLRNGAENGLWPDSYLKELLTMAADTIARLHSEKQKA